MDGGSSASIQARAGGVATGLGDAEPVSEARADVDRRVAEGIRHYRLARGLSQTQLAERMGISLQQVHKYETARNRIGAARLTQVVAILDIEIDWLFGHAAAPRERRPAGASRECLELIRTFQRVPEGRRRAAFLALLRSMGEHDGREAGDGTGAGEPDPENGHGPARD